MHLRKLAILPEGDDPFSSDERFDDVHFAGTRRIVPENALLYCETVVEFSPKQYERTGQSVLAREKRSKRLFQYTIDVIVV